MVFSQRKPRKPLFLAASIVGVALLVFAAGVFSAQEWPHLFNLSSPAQIAESKL